MKTFITLCCLAATATAQAQMSGLERKALTGSFVQRPVQRFVLPERHHSVGIGYDLGLAQGAFRQGMTPVHSVAGGVLWNLPFAGKRLLFGFDAGIGLYAYKQYQIDYRFEGNYINALVNYQSSAMRGGLSAQYLIGKERRVMPYLSAGAGVLRLASSFNIEDNDPSACRVLEQVRLKADATVYASYGAGLRWHLGAEGRNRQHFLDLSVHHVRGGAVNYVNVAKMHRHEEPVATSGKPVDARFINTSTNDMHRHTIAELYRNPLNLLQVRLGYSAIIGSR